MEVRNQWPLDFLHHCHFDTQVIFYFLHAIPGKRGGGGHLTEHIYSLITKDLMKQYSVLEEQTPTNMPWITDSLVVSLKSGNEDAPNPWKRKQRRRGEVCVLSVQGLVKLLFRKIL